MQVLARGGTPHHHHLPAAQRPKACRQVGGWRGCFCCRSDCFFFFFFFGLLSCKVDVGGVKARASRSAVEVRPEGGEFRGYPAAGNGFRRTGDVTHRGPHISRLLLELVILLLLLALRRRPRGPFHARASRPCARRVGGSLGGFRGSLQLRRRLHLGSLLRRFDLRRLCGSRGVPGGLGRGEGRRRRPRRSFLRQFPDGQSELHPRHDGSRDFHCQVAKHWGCREFRRLFEGISDCLSLRT
mmetsp:Transcript_61880/g.106335  ORF Transcript_61880/g.106335 Transcript_61880/m.106335 type:complete len:241 (-) Transcript_61880:529-1251(-)